METFSSHISFILIILKVTKDKLSFEMSTRTLAHTIKYGTISHFLLYILYEELNTWVIICFGGES